MLRPCFGPIGGRMVERCLLDGERVPGIAGALFLSASTVRNHLTAIFAKVGVHSQAELIHALKARSHEGDGTTT
jgi:DNA-binding NarL/FixJ family response regulator